MNPSRTVSLLRMLGGNVALLGRIEGQPSDERVHKSVAAVCPPQEALDARLDDRLKRLRFAEYSAPAIEGQHDRR